MFGLIREALGGKGFRADDEVKLLCNDGWKSNLKRFFKES
jgi:hypothetical protein